ncbi:amylo-alpha-1,6-glucosidase [Desmospora profundinema]|uniref:Glycogen debranching enzyme n=1 Tax=Desmospora profundinema TaxID=1571184 RepID=A0ABU1IPJ8_9BACL|nr:glycogen debranching N-terminal domain-containing protein [Desmospora profundinema]MDR6226323.1 glycogen debranching enzyme [Desmospora profundinema]
MNHVMKDGALFLHTDGKGNVPAKHGQGWGLYIGNIRLMSRMEWSLEGPPPHLVSGEADGAEGLYRFRQGEEADGFEVGCHRWIHEGILFERWTLKNRSFEAVEQSLTFRFDADFADIRTINQQEGRLEKERHVETKASGLKFSCRGEDGVERSMDVQFTPSPAEVTEEAVTWNLQLAPHGEQVVDVCYLPIVEGKERAVPPALEALADGRRSREAWMESCPILESDDEDLKAGYRRGLSDLYLLLVDSGEGMVPWAGLPWNGAIHGRDSLIAAWQSLMIRPDLAKGVLRTLARHQGRKEDAASGEEPGKIMGECQAQTPEYFSIESTPLFLILLAEWHHWTGDDDFLREMLPHVRKAMDWMDRRVEEGGGWIVSPAGHGWKSSLDVWGERKEEPVAWVDVQGYAIQAKRAWSRTFHYLGNLDDARNLSQEAKEWTKRLIRDFWQEEEGYFSTVRSGGEILPAVTGSPGHLLLAGILDSTRSEAVAERLLKPDLFSGWGIRTLSTDDPDYRPFSRHQGSVWPHDTAWIAAGMIEMGLREAADPLMRALLDAARAFPGHQLPERFAGHSRNNNKPVAAPAACSPQAISAGSLFTLLKGMTGLRPDTPRRLIRLSPHLPEGVNHLHLQGIRIGKGNLDIQMRRWEKETYVQVDRNTTGCQVVIA